MLTVADRTRMCGEHSGGVRRCAALPGVRFVPAGRPGLGRSPPKTAVSASAFPAAPTGGADSPADRRLTRGHRPRDSRTAARRGTGTPRTVNRSAGLPSTAAVLVARFPGVTARAGQAKGETMTDHSRVAIDVGGTFTDV